MYKELILAIVITSLGVGCTTITRGRTDTFTIESDPEGVSATLSTGETCTTPCTLVLPRKLNFTVTAEKEGFQPISAEVVPKQAGTGSAGMVGNIIFGGFIGMAVDANSGAMKDLYPNPLVIKLETLDSGNNSKIILPEKDEASLDTQNHTE